MSATEYLVWGTVAHLVCDWLLQNEFLAVHKVSLRGPAAYIHGGIQFAGAALVFPLPVAVALACAHVAIDTRVPLSWWQGILRQTRTGPAALHVAIWDDQVLHLCCLAAAALWSARR